MHTPGPWEAKEVPSAGWQIFAKVGEWGDRQCQVIEFSPLDCVTIKAHKDGNLYGLLAYESLVQFKSEPIREQWAGNAKLAAAAPELLDAIKALMAEVPPYSLGSPLMAKVHDAIAKAEGTVKV